MDVPSRFLSRVAISMYGPAKDGEGEGEEGDITGEEDQSYSKICSSDLYPPQKTVVDEGCPARIEFFPLLSGESVEYVGGLGAENYVAISNFRFFASQDNGFYNVPLGMIDSVEVNNSREQLVVLCKDARSFCLTFDTPTTSRTWHDRLQKAIRGAKDLDKTFAFIHRAYFKDQQSETSSTSSSTQTLSDFEHELRIPSPSLLSLKVQLYQDRVVNPEFHRLAMDLDSAWRITECNSKYELCPTYPKLFVVPHSITDDELRSVAKFRALGRVPAVVWRHPTNGSIIARSSQPLVGVLSWRNSEDEKLLLAISQACALHLHGHTHPQAPSSPVPIPHQNGGPPGQALRDRGQLARSLLLANGNPGSAVILQNSRTPNHTPSHLEPDLSQLPELLVMDLRSYTAVLGNRAKGGGCECQDYYPNCEIQYKSLSNIHSVRKSFQQLRNVLIYDDEPNFLSNLESTRWLYYLSQLISVAIDVIRTVNDRGRPVLVHCSDGWDRTAQVVPLAELLLDPYYRTIEGFQVLVEREWLGYGHRFSDRCGQTAACTDVSQRCPVFLQWLDCVHQLLLQFPCDFEFNQNFLVKLGLHSYSCLFGTLMGNTMKEREEARLKENTLSLWSFLHSRNPDVVNHLYQSTTPQVLYPVSHMHKMQLWRAMYTSSILMHKPKPQPVEKRDFGNSFSRVLPALHRERKRRAEKGSEGSGREGGGGGGGKGRGGGEGGGEGRGSKAGERGGGREGGLNEERKTIHNSVPSSPKPASNVTGGDSGMVMEMEVKEVASDRKLSESERDISESSFASVSSSPSNTEENEQREGVRDEEGVGEGGEEEREKDGGGGGGDGGGGGGGEEEDKDGGGEGGGEVGEGESKEGERGGREIGEAEEEERTSLQENTEKASGKDGEDTEQNISDTPSETSPPLTAVPSSLSSSNATMTTSSTPQTSLVQGLAESPNTQALNTMDTSLLHDAMHDHSPHLQRVLHQAVDGGSHRGQGERRKRDKTRRREEQERKNFAEGSGGGWGLDLDGMPRTCGEVDQRLGDIVRGYEAMVADLRRQLAKAKAAARSGARNMGRGEREEEGEVGKEEGDYDGVPPFEDDQPSSSLNSWDCVDRSDSVGVRWVPDHAVTNCHECGTSFSLIIRKHHCRSCGGVFCSKCTDYMCPVPAEQLFSDVRVCGKCYYRLDGHLRSKSTEPT